MFKQAVGKVLENVTSIKLWAFIAACYFFHAGKLDQWSWVVLAASFISSRVLEYVTNRK